MTSPEQSPVRFSLRRLLAIVAVIAVGVALYQTALGPPPMSRLFGSSENLAIVREATRVEAYRLAPPAGVDPFLEETSPLEYRMVGDPVTVTKELAKTLQTTLLSSDTYEWEMAKACGHPVYGVKLSFYRGGDRVDVYFCFSCLVLAVVRDQKTYMPEDFDNGKQVFVDAVKELFPTDAEIQAIRE